MAVVRSPRGISSPLNTDRGGGGGVGMGGGDVRVTL